LSFVFLTAEWRHLAMVNFEIDPAVLEPLVPRGTVLDGWGGRTYVSLVGFLFLRTRVLGLPVPFHGRFEEVNLRFYVRREAEEGPRRGVVFIKEIVPRRVVAAAARTLYGENYEAMAMRHEVDTASGSFGYGWLAGGRWQQFQLQTAGELQFPAVGSIEEFTVEHYWGYTRLGDGGAREYRVEHRPWRVWLSRQFSLGVDFTRVYGSSFAGLLPHSAFVADGSAVRVDWGRRI
jgi:uncharacterized protein YqjF (DUF2071 family)